MELLAGANSYDILKGNYVYLDNDFLNLLYKNADVFTQSLEYLKSSERIVDPFTKFEFLRGIYVPGEKKAMENFIDFFTSPINHNDLFLNIQKNALALSMIYCHNKMAKGVSTVDLLLAGRIMYHASEPLLITGNKKDFPSCIFDNLTVFNIEQISDGSIQSFSVVKFNREKFKTCIENLDKVA
ncbi:MAG: hypothetical protein WDA13_01185 [Candidatus Shapirobacteria bacterium]